MSKVRFYIGSALWLLPAGALAQTTVSDPQASTPVTTASPPAPSTPASGEIVVTGIRNSLAQAESIKRNSSNVVDSIVADDIGKFPDVSTAAALQRVPGVQVSTASNNEIVGPIIRGLGDVFSTLNGREIFSGVSRNFNFQDLPAEALAGADVYKSTSAELLEGGVAGLVNLRLHRAFDFKKLTIAGSARETVADEAGDGHKLNPNVGLLVADRWQTGIGEIGALVDVSYQRTNYSRPIGFNDYPRSGNEGPPGAEGVQLPTGYATQTEFGRYERPQANFSLQWKPSSDLEIYSDGLFAGYRANYGQSSSQYDIHGASSISDLVTGDDCHDYAVGPDGYHSTNVQGTDNPDGTGHIEHLCNAESFHVGPTTGTTLTRGMMSRSNLYLIAGGVRYNHGRLSLNWDNSYEYSTARHHNFRVAMAKHIDGFDYVRSDGSHAGTVDTVGNPMADPDGYAFVNAIQEDIDKSDGKLFATSLDGTYRVGGILQEIQFGGRFATRKVNYQAYSGGNAAPGGNYATLVSSVGLPANFLVPMPGVPQVNGGATILAPDPALLRDPAIQAQLRSIFGEDPGVPAFDPTRNYRASEKTYAGYVQGKYEIPLWGDVTVDGLFGGRLTRTDRTISGAGLVKDPNTGVSTLVPVQRSTSDTNILPNFSARLRLTPKMQFRFNYSEAIYRPSFSSLNPGIDYTISYISTVQNTGSAGNPDLKPEKSQNFDVTAEYYFNKSSYISAALYYKDIHDRVINQADIETIDGQPYVITRPRNLGGAQLKGLELTAQTFFDFLPGAFSGIGVFGNFTIADSKVTTKGDRLYGLPLFGVSKYNYNIGLIYEKYGLSTRLVYTYRSHYGDYDRTTDQSLRPTDVGVFIGGIRGMGRLDLSVNYDLLPGVTVSLNGTNLTHAGYRTYDNIPLYPRDARGDDTTYSFGVRFKL